MVVAEGRDRAVISDGENGRKNTEKDHDQLDDAELAVVQCLDDPLIDHSTSAVALHRGIREP